MTDRHVKCNKSVIVILHFLKNNHHYLYQVLRMLVCKPIINDFAFKVTEAEMFSIVTLYLFNLDYFGVYVLCPTRNIAK